MVWTKNGVVDGTMRWLNALGDLRHHCRCVVQMKMELQQMHGDEDGASMEMKVENGCCYWSRCVAVECWWLADLVRFSCRSRAISPWMCVIGAWREVANKCRGDERWFTLPWWHDGPRVINGGGVGSNCCGWCR